MRCSWPCTGIPIPAKTSGAIASPSLEASFMENIRATFEGGGEDSERDFDDLHELFAKMSEGLSSEQSEERKPIDVTAQHLRILVRLRISGIARRACSATRSRYCKSSATRSPPMPVAY